MSGKTSHIHGVKNLVTLKGQHAQINLKFQSICYQNPHLAFFTEVDKLILKFVCKYKGPRRVKAILKKKNKEAGLTVLYFKTYNKSTEIKTV